MIFFIMMSEKIVPDMTIPPVPVPPVSVPPLAVHHQVIVVDSTDRSVINSMQLEELYNANRRVDDLTNKCNDICNSIADLIVKSICIIIIITYCVTVTILPIALIVIGSISTTINTYNNLNMGQSVVTVPVWFFICAVTQIPVTVNILLMLTVSGIPRWRTHIGDLMIIYLKPFHPLFWLNFIWIIYGCIAMMVMAMNINTIFVIIPISLVCNLVSCLLRYSFNYERLLSGDL